MKKKSKFNATLTAKQLESSEIVATYAHPDSGRSVARHLDGEGYTATGLHCGKADDKLAAAAAKAEAEHAEQFKPKTSKKPPQPPKAS